nr:A-kinase anchor protein 13 [Pelodiscus sinensis]|eukprot:XP_006115322.1 A-kinase anchor protein 13 [Pelodiscus sinensis]
MTVASTKASICPHVPRMNSSAQWPGACDGAPCRAQCQKRRCMSAVEQGSCPDGDPEADWEVEEEGDRFLGVPLRRLCKLRSSMHPPDSFRRHSWEPGKELQSDPDYDQLSVSLKELDSTTGQLDDFSRHRRDPRRAPIIRSNDELESLLSQDEEEEDLERAQKWLLMVKACGSDARVACLYIPRSVSLKELDSTTGQLDDFSRHRRDPRRAPIIRSNDELESLLSQDEEEEDLERAQEDARRLQAYRTGQHPASSALSKSISLSGIDSFPNADEISLFASGTDLANGFNAGSYGQLDTTGEAGDQESQHREGSPIGRTLSFFRKMTGKSKNKEKMKEREKDGKEKDARYTNGHLFTTITVSGMTMCFACNKSITAKEALICPSE